MGRVQILGGKHAKRWIHFNDETGIRPTGVRVRKILFDWLRFDIANKTCLDLFSGSGLLAFEALSQGALSAHCIDNNATNCKMIEQEVLRIGEPNITVQCASIPKLSLSSFDMVFMDAPFDNKALLDKTLKWLCTINLVASSGFLYVESAHKIDELLGFDLHRSKQVGNVYMQLFMREANE